MTSRRFPRSPEITPRPIDGDHNPFADDAATPLSSSANPLASPANDDVQPFFPLDYERTQSDRSNRILFLGCCGAAFVTASLVIVLVVAVRSAPFTSELVYSLPTDLLGLSFCIPAWIMASADCRAIQSGVIDRSAWKRTRIGWWCGGLGTLAGTVPFFGIVIVIFGSLFA